MMHTIIILDFETTGLNPYLNDIIEIAIKEYGSDKYYQTLVEPKRLPKGLVTYIPPHITNITSITDQMIIDESITKEKAFYNMLQYIETVSKDDNPIYLVYTMVQHLTLSYSVDYSMNIVRVQNLLDLRII